MTNTFLFIGYSFKDEIVLKAIQKLNSYIGKNKKAFYAIMLDDSEKNKDFALFVSDLEKDII